MLDSRGGGGHFDIGVYIFQVEKKSMHANGGLRFHISHSKCDSK